MHVVSHLINLHRMLSSLGSAALTSVWVLRLQSLSATALPRGQKRDRKLVASTYSAHMQASPPITNLFWSSVPVGVIDVMLTYILLT